MNIFKKEFSIHTTVAAVSEKPHKVKDKSARAVSGTSLCHSMSGGGRHDYLDFKTSKQMFGFNYEKCSGAESNNNGGVYQNNSL